MKKRHGTQRIVHDDPRWLARQPRSARVRPPRRADHDHTEDMWLEIDPETELRPVSLQGAIGQLSNVSKLSVRMDRPQVWMVATGTNLRIGDFKRALSSIGISVASWFLFAVGRSYDAERSDSNGGRNG